MDKIKRNILLNPGPATTTDTVKMAQVVPDICPREKEFGNVLQQMQKDLIKIVHGDTQKHTAVLFCGSGTICMDACLNSLLPENKRVLIINNGAYSSRAVDICRFYSLPLLEMKLPSDQRPDLEAIDKILRENPDISLVYTTHNETGTGLLNPIREIGAVAHRHGAVFVVDTIASYAMIPIDMTQDNIDFCMASAQKGLMSMTGLSYVIGVKDEIEKSSQYPTRSYYCNLYRQHHQFESTGEMHFTPPVQTVYATQQAIKEYFQEGETAKWNRHKRVFDAIHSYASKLGFRCPIPKDWQSGLVVALEYPEDPNWNFTSIHDYCYERGYTIYPGKIDNAQTFRLCSLGAIDTGDIDSFFQVFAEALRHYDVKLPVTYADNNR